MLFLKKSIFLFSAVNKVDQRCDKTNTDGKSKGGIKGLKAELLKEVKIFFHYRFHCAIQRTAWDQRNEGCDIKDRCGGFQKSCQKFRIDLAYRPCDQAGKKNTEGEKVKSDLIRKANEKASQSHGEKILAAHIENKSKAE